jgi:hypothetical protein
VDDGADNKRFAVLDRRILAGGLGVNTTPRRRRCSSSVRSSKIGGAQIQEARSRLAFEEVISGAQECCGVFNLSRLLMGSVPGRPQPHAGDS